MRRRDYHLLVILSLIAVGCGDNLRPAVDANGPDSSSSTDAAVDAGVDATPVDSCVGMPDGMTCDDDNACTQTDRCASGACVGADAVTCSAADACHVDGVCDPATGTCSTPTAPDGTTCDDANACTTSEACSAGVCVGANAPTGTMCDDGDACTQMDACVSGTCAGGNSVTCAAQDACHVAGVCDPANGTCSSPIAPDGTTCSDSNACTQTDACVAGACTGTNPVACTASDACHVAGACNPQTGQCSNPIAPNGTTCNDSNLCTQTDRCQGGNCLGTNPVACTASDQCHSRGTCNPQTGICSNPPAPNNTVCNDGDLCTENDRCQNGSCAAGPPLTCSAIEQCFLPGSCDPQSGVCTNPTAPDGSTCDDGDACTVDDSCASGACAGNPRTCAPLDQCHVAGTCDATSGNCSNPNAPNGTPCTGGACQNGVCAPTTPVCGNGQLEGAEQCDDGNAIDCDGCSPQCRRQTYVETTGNVIIADGSNPPLQWCLNVVVPAGAGDGDDVVDKVCLSKVGINHDWVGDLTIALQGPTGLQTTVMNRPGSIDVTSFGDSSDLVDSSPIAFMDAATDDPETMGNTLVDSGVVCQDDGRCVYTPNNGAAQPQKLSRFNNLASVGTWRVCAGDGAVSSEGTLTIGGITVE